MGEILIVRHAQASFHLEDYDQLSELGHSQAKVLAERISSHIKPTQIISGSQKRHRQSIQPTIDLLGNLDEPSYHQVLSGFDEFDFFNVLQQQRKDWHTKAIMMADLRSQAHPKKSFEQIFRTALERWVSGQFDHEYLESWQTFQDRVTTQVQQVHRSAKQGERILIMTSGGPISVICQYLLGLSDRKTFELNATIANTSITRLLYNANRLSLTGFNDFSHLETAGVVTYR